jgi:hypothetical protein
MLRCASSMFAKHSVRRKICLARSHEFNLGLDCARLCSQSKYISLYDRNSSLPTKGIKSTAVYLIVLRLLHLHPHEESCSFNYICEKTRTYIASRRLVGAWLSNAGVASSSGRKVFELPIFFLIVVVNVRCECSNRSWRRLTERGAAFFHERSRANSC